MNKPILLILFIMSFFSSFSQVESTAYNLMLKTLLSNSVTQITVEEASKTRGVFLDARERKEFDVSHIKEATWVGYDNFELKRLPSLQKNEPIIIYCSVGYRSEKIGEVLIKEGYTKVFNLYGGIFEWINQNKPVVDNHNQPTKQVHAYSKTWGIWLSKGEKIY